jgi:hypothetical protein
MTPRALLHSCYIHRNTQLHGTCGWFHKAKELGYIRIFPIAFVSKPAMGPTQPSVKWVPGVLSLGLKSGQGFTLTTYPHLVPKSWMRRSYTFSPPQARSSMNRTALLLHHSYQSVVTHQDVAATHTSIQPTHHMYLGLLWGTTWVYTTYGLCSAPPLAHRCSQKDGPNRHSLSMRRNTQVEGHAKTVGQQHGRSKQPCWWDSRFINLTGLKN